MRAVECATPGGGEGRGEKATPLPDPRSKDSKLTPSDRAEAHQGFGLTLGRAALVSRGSQATHLIRAGTSCREEEGC